ncbi:MAG: 2-amino-4-hydroxy-6-hydroxymethyldihydropteridine diphosphokinase [Alphaproteobacteria bacterium]
MIIIAIGANLDIQSQSNKYQTCINALRYLNEKNICTIIKTSDWFETTAWPDPKKPPYINGVAIVEPQTDSPKKFLEQLHDVEAYFGRERLEKWGNRTIDLDILLWNNICTINQNTTQGLAIPHPRMLERAFVLLPLAQIAPNIVIPNTSLTIQEHLQHLQYDSKDISLYKKA